MGRFRPNPSLIHLRSGFCPITRTFYSTRPPVLLPSENKPFSAAGYALSLQSTSTHSKLALIQSSTGIHISYSQFRLYVDTLAFSLWTEVGLCRNDVAFVLSQNSTSIPILYFALLSIGVIVCPANPVGVGEEISRQIKISKPTVVFATSMTAEKLPEHGCRKILIDSDEFEHMMVRKWPVGELREQEWVRQDDVVAILFSSGTTGQVKGVAITHHNLIAITAEYYQLREERSSPVVGLYVMPYFHILGFHFILKSVALAETVVVMERFHLAEMLAAVEKFKATNLAVVPAVVVAMVKSNLTEKFEMGSLKAVRSGAAPLGMDLFAAFSKKFPWIYIYQGYGMTETSGTIFKPICPEKYGRWSSVGKLVSHAEAKIVDLDTGEGLPPGKPGELWIKGVTVMKGYVDDSKVNIDVWACGEWLRTGDICYVDGEGYLFEVDRLKELIKYKGYQVPPAELEQFLLTHPDISDAAVIPYPDKEAGQVPLALVVLRHPQCNVDERQIIDFIGQRVGKVAPYKKIRRVVFVDSIPKTASGKILRTQLRNTLPSNL